MENSMTTIDELNKAIETLREECKKHGTCAVCPLSEGYMECRVYGYKKIPKTWETIEEGDSDGKE